MKLAVRRRGRKGMGENAFSSPSFAPLVLALALVVAPYGAGVRAAPIGFNTALPVSKGEALWRMMFVAGRAGSSDMGDTRARTLAVRNVVGYGIAPDLAVFAALPVADRRLSPAKGASRSAGGIGDASLFARWTLFARDMPGRTLRVAPFFGVKLPIGEDGRRDAFGPLPRPLQPGSGTTDLFFGVVLTRMGVDGGFDLEWRHDLRGHARGIDAGDRSRINGSFQRRLATIGSPTTKPYGLLYGLIEMGFERTRADRSVAGAGVSVPRRHQAVVRPGLQFAARRFILEGAFELPFARSRLPLVPRGRWRLLAGVRANF